MPARQLLTAFVVAGALLAGCGDDGGGGGGDLSDEEQDFVDAAMADFDAEDAAPLTEEDAECIVTSMVEIVGVDELEEAGITAESFSDDGDLPSGLTEDQAGDVVGAIDSCVDLRQMFLDAMAEDASLDDETKECLADQFDDDFIQRIMILQLTSGEDALADDDPITAEVMAAFSECPEALN